MYTMKKSILSVVFLGITLLGMSQIETQSKPQGTPQERAKKMTQRMKVDLKLTDVQEKQVLDVNLKQAERLEKLRIAQEEIKKERKTIMEEREKSLSTILTPEQFEKLKTLQQERKEKIKEKKKN
jgi:Spy/CpxP family protein refolding chaperone